MVKRIGFLRKVKPPKLARLKRIDKSGGKSEDRGKV